MSYTILNADGTTLLTLADQSYDNVTTSLTLIGKNSNAYGQSVNENFVLLLENFANVSEPRSPVTGQQWYNTLEGRMYVYTTSTFKPVSGSLVSSTAPGNLVAGDLWLDSVNNQLWVWNGTKLVSTSKQYADSVGKAGWLVETVQDIGLNVYNVSNLYNDGVLLGVLSEQPITLNSNYITTYNTSTIRRGFTLNPAFGDIRFWGTATSADSVAGFDSSSFLTKNTTTNSGNVMTVPLFVQNNVGATIGASNNLTFYVNGNTSTIYNAVPNTILDIQANNGSNAVSMITINGATERVGINNNTPAYPLDVIGDVRVVGNLTVIGTQTNIEVARLQVQDINIELGSYQTTSSDAFVNGGGIVLHGASDHTILYDNSSTSWDFSENIQLAVNKGYYINTQQVLDANNVYSIGAPKLLNLGVTTPMNQILFGGMSITSSTIASYAANDLTLRGGTGFINVSSSTIVNLAPTNFYSTTSTAAVTKKYVDDEISLNAGGLQGRKPYTLSVDVTYFVNVNQDIKSYLDKLLPVNGGPAGSAYAQPDGSICTVLAMTYAASTATSFLTLNKSYVQLSTGTNVLEDVAGEVLIVVPPPMPTYVTKLYQVSTGTWTYIQDIT